VSAHRPPIAHWLIATRPQFLTAMALPVLLGTAFAWHDGHPFAPLPFVMAITAGILLHAAANVVNDIIDHQRGADPLNTNPLTPFAGGSRSIQTGRLTVAQMRQLALMLLGIATALGIGLILLAGWPLLWIGIIGLLIGLGYSAGPWPLNYHGLGEPAVAITFGLLTVAGSYFTQAQGFTPQAWLLGLPVGLLVAAILLVNEFPDAPSDAEAGKQTWVVLFGPKKARAALGALLLLPFVILIGGTLAGMWPAMTLIALLALPLAFQGWHRTPAIANTNQARLPGIKAVIASHALFTLLLTLGLIAQGIVNG